MDILNHSFEPGVAEALSATSISEPIPLPYYPLRYDTDHSNSVVSNEAMLNMCDSPLHTLSVYFSIYISGKYYIMLGCYIYGKLEHLRIMFVDESD